MRFYLLPVVAATLLSACTDGVGIDANGLNDAGSSSVFENTVAGTVSADGALTNTEAAIAINDPINTVSEPDAQPWVGTTRQRTVGCSASATQSAADAFATSAFTEVHDDEGSYLVSGIRTNNDSQYIEFCVTAPEFARYQINTRVQASEVFEDSFFVTIDEDTPGEVAKPGIYDISRSTQFKDDTVRTRTENPLTVTLIQGTHLIRFYLREPNSAIRSITLEQDEDGVPVVPPESSAIVQCAANTGLSVADVDALVTQHLGNAERAFVLTPFEEERGYILRNDYKWDTSEGRGNIMCLAPPPVGGTNLVDNSVSVGRLVIGSQGVDVQRLNTPVRGTFIGNGGNDDIGSIDGGLFVGGDGDDVVRLIINEGTFEGGAGNDEVQVMRSGEYFGEAGDDTVGSQFGGVFDGGDGYDSVLRRDVSAIALSVESDGVLFEPLPAPSNIEFLNSTSTSTLVSWTASPDPRVDGYLVTNAAFDQVDELVLSFGIGVGGFAGPRTSSTQALLDVIFTETARIQVRAYTELVDGTVIYSEALEGIFVAPTDPGADAIFASIEVPEADLTNTVTLAANGNVISWNFRAPTISNTPAFYRHDSQLQNETPVFNDSLANAGYRIFPGDTRQYALVSGEDGARSTVIGFDGDVSQVLWEQQLPEALSDVLSFGNASYVTQDDWFVAVRDVGQRVVVIDPQGTQFVLDTQALPFNRFPTLTDGDNGVLVHFPDVRVPSPVATTQFPTYYVVDIFSGEQRQFTLDNIVELAGAAVTPRALAVDGNHFVLAGTFVDNCTNDDSCTQASQLQERSFLARIQVNDGTVQAVSIGELSDSAGNGTGKLLGRSVYFKLGDAYTRYNADSLELEAKALVPGDVQDFSDDAVLSIEAVLDEERFLISYRYYLSRPQ